MVNMDLKSSEKIAITINDKPKRRRLNIKDPDFEPPDGGWGWLIVFACGFSNLCTFPMFQQFGLVFRSKFEELGITETQTTTVINLNSAFNAGMGLTNGPLFRRFTYRKVAMFGSCLVAGSLLICSFCESFWTYLIFFSICYGCGIGTTQSANALALNTYFKQKRRIATGFSWTTTALGPTIWPYIIVALNEAYGMEGTLLLFSALALHSFVCSLLLHPVEWHTKYKVDGPDKGELLEKPDNDNLASIGKLSNSRSLFSSQYLRTEDDPLQAGYEITYPGTPMMVRSNDGWYSQSKSQRGSRLSLSSNKASKLPSGQNSVGVSQRPSYNNLLDATKEKEKQRKRKISTNKPAIKEEAEEPPQESIKDEEMKLLNSDLKIPVEYPNEKEVLKSAAKKLAQYEQEVQNTHQNGFKKTDDKPEEEEEKKEIKLSIWRKISIFFDFELFKDPIYVNLMLGLTVANFAELNFSILTPIVLKEFNFGKYQIATFMSLLGATDIVVRFFIPFIADKVGWSNKAYFLLGVLAMAFGRIILVHTQTYGIGLFVAVIIGAGKGLRTIFIALVIPGYVPLDRLAAASGLQLATSGLLFVILGPVVGWIREMVGDYVITLHILNICTYATAVAWLTEDIITMRRKRNQKEIEKQSKT